MQKTDVELNTERDSKKIYKEGLLKEIAILSAADHLGVVQLHQYNYQHNL